MPGSTSRKCIRLAPAKADNWTTDTFLKAAEACLKGGVPSASALAKPPTPSIPWRDLPVLRRRARRRKGNLDVKTDAVRQALEYYKKLMPSCRRMCRMGRCLQQQVAGVGQGRPDHESAERLGGGQARRAANRGAMLDPWLPGGPERPLCAVPALFLDRWNSPRTRKRRRACWPICRSRHRSKNGNGQRRL